MSPSTNPAKSAAPPRQVKTEEKHNEEEWREKRRHRNYLRPVAWLLGRQLLSSLKGTLLFTAYGSKLDARDWMRAEEFPFATPEAARKFLAGARKARGETPADAPPESGVSFSEIEAAADEWWRRQAEQAEGGGPAPERGEFWFDYISDTGDGMKATYSIAYLCTSDLWVRKPLAALQTEPFGSSRNGPAVGFVAGPDAPTEPSDEYPNADLNRAADALDASAHTALRRGQFLLVGGDATYHLSDYESLHTRFQTPFTWAHADVRRDRRLLKRGRRPLFGIPGNHDYYDQLDGFRRQFHHPVREDEGLPAGAERRLGSPQLMLPGFFRRQTASYVSLRLPFGWLLWGLDTEVGKLDERQRKFFRSVKVKDGRSVNEGATPDRLIVATSAPTTVFGKYADRDDEKSGKAFYQLGLPRPFLDPEDREAKDRDNRLAPHQCRLDLSGDIHHYARYWGRASGDDPRGHARRDDARQHPEQKDNYASVVSGLGGAFHHPTTTYAGEICEQVLYPPVEESRQAVAGKIFNPWRILLGGGVGVIGFVLAFLICFAALVAQSSRRAAADFPRSRAEEPVRYTIGASLPIASLVLIGLAFWPAERFYKKYRRQEEMQRETIPRTRKEGPDADGDGRAAGADAAADNVTQSGARQRFAEIISESIDVASGDYDEGGDQDCEWYEKLMRQFSIWVYLAVVPSVLALAGSILILAPYVGTRDNWFYGNSLMVLFTLLWAAAAAVMAVRYTDWLSEMAAKITLGWRHWVLVLLLAGPAALGVIAGFAVFGRGNNAADMFTDIMVTLVVAGLVVGLTLLGFSKFGEVKPADRRGKFRAFGLALGLFHAALQLLTPFLLVYLGTGLAWLASLVVLIAAQFAGLLVMRSRAYKLLPLVWLAAGSLMLAIPYAAFRLAPDAAAASSADAASQTFFCRYGVVMRWFGADAELRQLGAREQALREQALREPELRDSARRAQALPELPGVWGRLGVCLVAGLYGLLLSCVWIGWYFATALVCHGHNNEAGGASQIERFKQFIRFRLTADDLTGFVIAVDDPAEDGNRLRPRLVDVIHLTLKRR